MIFRYYFWGALSLVVFWAISWIVTKKLWPFAMVQGNGGNGENDNHSASLLQMLVFTMLAVFAYTTVFAARAYNMPGVLTWFDVPSNLLVLMGISVGTAVGSRAIKVEQVKTNAMPAEDQSSLTTNRGGKTDLVKIQMLIWTAIGVTVYLINLYRFLHNPCFLGTAPETCASLSTIPDIDTAFMVLLGVSQGGYVVNQLSETSQNGDTAVTKITVQPGSVPLTANAASKLTATFLDAKNNVVSGRIPQWVADNPSAAIVDQDGNVTAVKAGTCNIVAKSNGITSNACVVTVT